MNYTEIGQRIRKFRKLRGLTQEALSDAADLSPSYLSHIENGKKKSSLEALIRIADALGVSVDQLLSNRQPFVSARQSELHELLETATEREQNFLCEIVRAIRQSLKDNNFIP